VVLQHPGDLDSTARDIPDAVRGSPMDAAVQAQNHDPSRIWDPMVDYQMMSRNVRGESDSG
jgi:hypothetical protein